ncbi:MAG: regulatory iron-sulfur-containing complex subunit RicT [Planctomycetota bacterium]
MPGSITPLPIMLEEEDRKIYDRLEPPKTIVVRYGYQRLVAELPYSGGDKPGCGSKLVARTPRGTELVEMLTTTCPNSGCGKSVSRSEMLDYIKNSGGKQYPFTTKGRIERVATIDDLNEQARVEGTKPETVKLARRLIHEHGLDEQMKLVDVEPILGGEKISFYFTAPDRIDFRELVKSLAGELHTRIEMVHVNDREEARLVADYEKCGQHCCCKQFLKVLKPVSMRAAKVQKATLDPQKISGRCGRLMCCLRYEDQTYDELRKRLPNRKSWVETPDGIGQVWDTQILTQLVLVKLGPQAPEAVPMEDIVRFLTPEECKEQDRMLRERQREAAEAREERSSRRRGGRDLQDGGKPRRERSDSPDNRDSRSRRPADGDKPQPQAGDEQPGDKPRKKRGRRRRKKRGDGEGPGNPEGPAPESPSDDG